MIVGHSLPQQQLRVAARCESSVDGDTVIVDSAHAKKNSALLELELFANGENTGIYIVHGQVINQHGSAR